MSRAELARLPAPPLRHYLAECPLTHEEISERAGVTREVLRKVIYDQDRLTTTQAIRIAVALNVHPETIWADWHHLVGARLFVFMPWSARARCRGESTQLFFAPAGERPKARQVREWDVKRRLCAVCPVVEECRAWARDQREYGLWGGETEEERAAAGFAPAMPIGDVARIARLVREEAV